MNLIYIGKSLANQIPNPIKGLSFCTLEELNQSKISHDEYPLLLDRIKRHDFVNEICIISTCNRFELILETKHRISEPELQSIINEIQSINGIQAQYNILHDQEAELQILRTYCGLNSSLVGETEISAQFEISFKQCLHMGYIGSKLLGLYEKAESLRRQIDNDIFEEEVSYCGLAISKSLERFKDKAFSKSCILGSGSTAYQSTKALIKLGMSPEQIYIVHRISSSSSQISKFKETKSFAGLNYFRCKDGYHITKVKDLISDSDLLVFTIDSKNPVLNIGLNSKLKIIDFNSQASCSFETYHEDYISSEELNNLVSTVSSIRTKDPEFTKQLKRAERYIEESVHQLSKI